MTSEVNAAAAPGATPGAPDSAAAPTAATPAPAAPLGTGSAREGAHHWWLERLTSLATFILFVWFAVSLLRLPGYDHSTVTEWLSSPLAAVPMLLLILATFWHIKLGLQVIVEDYVHDDANRLFMVLLVNFAVVLAAAFAAFAILKVALGAGPGAG
ncbi:succinate dehydrogenase, hydrophobic membrane anchor protein [Allosphingosinicella sp.]|jgi:succinate dehydrogenase / fumarate reductase membrane anchor subunit|uniref:succinate dehydrogenase, hydrophobic membrane anchor protein n=1 Tax=Allosphingosinicella sp. TaxID=2823234 RepID=UPI002F1374F4